MPSAAVGSAKKGPRWRLEDELRLRDLHVTCGGDLWYRTRGNPGISCWEMEKEGKPKGSAGRAGGLRKSKLRAQPCRCYWTSAGVGTK